MMFQHKDLIFDFFWVHNQLHIIGPIQGTGATSVLEIISGLSYDDAVVAAAARVREAYP